MKIGIITKHLDLPVGFGTYATKLLDALAALDQANEYVVYTTHAPKRQDWPTNFHVKNFEIPKVRSKETRWDHVTAPLAAKADGVDLVHTLHTATALPPIRRPVITNILDAIGWAVPGYRLPPVYQALARRDVLLASHLITISEAAKHDIQQLLRVKAEKISVTHLAGPSRVARQAAPKQPYYLFVGGTEKRKNLRTLLEAWASADFRGMRLKIVGNTLASPIADSRAELVALLSPARASRVDWLGRVGDAELDRLYKEATALVFPSLYEGFGLPILEAMARRTPVITSDVSSLPEVAGGAAILVDPRDAAALGAAMQDIRKKATAASFSEAGAANAKRFTWKKTAQATLAVYEQVYRDAHA